MFRATMCPSLVETTVYGTIGIFYSVCRSICSCISRLCAYHQQKQLCLCDNWYILFRVQEHMLLHIPTMCLSSVETTVFIGIFYSVCRSICSCIPDSHPHRITSTKCRINSCFCWWWAHSRPKHIEIVKYSKNKYIKNKLCPKLALCTKLCKGYNMQPEDRSR